MYDVNKISFKMKLFTRLLSLFFCIIIPIYIISMVLFNNGTGIILNEINNSTYNNMKYILDDIDNNIFRIKNTITEYASDDSLLDMSLNSNEMSDYTKVNNIIKIQRNLSTIKNSSTYISDIGLTMFPTKKIIKTIGNVNALNEQFASKLVQSYSKNGTTIFEMDNKIYLIALDSYSSVVDPRIMIYVEISPQTIKDMISNSINDNNKYYVLNFTNIKWVLSNADQDVIRFIDNSNKNPNETANANKTVVINSEKYYLMKTTSMISNAQFTVFIPENNFLSKIINYKYLFIIFSLLVLLLSMTYTFITCKYVHNPLKRIVQAFKQLEGGDTYVSIEYSVKNEFGYLYRQFNKMVKNLRDLIENNYKKEILVKNAQLKQLQSQINPHFLYNSFFLLSSMMKEKDYGDAEIFSSQLGRYFKYITRNASDEVLLLQEVEHARLYCDIQHKRYMNRINVQFDNLPEDMKALRIPKLILQPLIENAFEHGLVNVMENGLLMISFSRNKDTYYINIDDNGNELSDDAIERLRIDAYSPDSEATGIVNIYRRLIIHYGENGGLTIRRSSMGGLGISIFFPGIQ